MLQNRRIQRRAPGLSKEQNTLDVTPGQAGKDGHDILLRRRCASTSRRSANLFRAGGPQAVASFQS